MNDSLLPAAAQLMGKNVGTDWLVIKKLDTPYGGTGGNFGYSYVVQNQAGAKAHLKALDFSRAMQSEDPAVELQKLTEAYLHERFLLEECKGKRFSKIVRIIESGKISIKTFAGTYVVQFLICEFAEGGDIRRFLNVRDTSDKWILDCLHSVAVGIQQLHSVDIAHQDIKPSNVLVFDEFVTKLGDLGRASKRGKPIDHDQWACAADQAYAPPEQAYDAPSSDFSIRRLTTDFYHLGSLISFFYVQTNANSLLFNQLPPKFHPACTGESYDRLLPVLLDSFSHNITTVKEALPDSLKDPLGTVFEYLCNPDPKLRGDPLERISKMRRKPGIQRIISKLDLTRKREALKSSE